jgi:hypothetical protein
VRLLVLARKAQAVFCLVGHRNKEEEEIYRKKSCRPVLFLQ